MRSVSKYKSLVFLGTSKDPEVYFQWEDNMEKWLQSNYIPKKNKLVQGDSAFTEKAYRWCLRENIPSVYNKLILYWGDLKAKMYRDFAKKYQSRKCITKKTQCQATPKRVMSTPMPQSASKHNNHYGAPVSRKVFTRAFIHQPELKKSAQAKKGGE